MQLLSPGSWRKLFWSMACLADTFINVNVPDSAPLGIRITRQGKRVYEDAIVQNCDPRGRTYYWIGAGDLGFQNLEGSDFHAVQNGYVSVTPLHLDLTNYAAMDRIRQWGLEETSLTDSKSGAD